MAVEISQLFSHQRIGDTRTAVLLALYFPIGLIFALLRSFIALHVFVICCILPRRFPFRSGILRTLYMSLGLIVLPSKPPSRSDSVKVIVANHVSVLDHVVLGLLFPSVVPNVWNLPPFLNWALGYTDMGAEHGRQKFLEAVGRHCQQDSKAVLAFPEGAMTNGTAGLLKFSSWAFSLNQDVQPFIIRTHRPLLNIRVEALGCSLWQDLLWFLFVPFTIFKIRMLPVQPRSEYENSEDFSQGVQQFMAAALRVEPTSYTSADKAEYVKRVNTEASASGSSRSASSQQTRRSNRASASARMTPNQAIERMVKQVQEVLPHVPADIIRRDLESTNSVDGTIFNILENDTAILPPSEDVPPTGTTASTSQNAPQSAPQNTPQGLSHNTYCMTSHGSSDLSTPSPACTKFAAGRFGGSSSERQQSLKERKADLLASARRRFTEKSEQGE